MKGFKIFLVMCLVTLGLVLEFRGQHSGALSGLIAGVALIEAFVIYNYEAEIVGKRRK